MRVEVGDYRVRNGWRSRRSQSQRPQRSLSCDGLGWGLSRAERRPWPRGTLTQRAIDMEALYGITVVCWLQGPERPATKKDRRRKKIKGQKQSHPSMPQLLLGPCSAS